MNGKPFTLGLVLILGVLILGGCEKGEKVVVKAPDVIQGSGNVVAEDRTLSSFNRVSLIGSGEVIITQGEEESLTVETDDNLMPYIRTEVKNRTLILGFTDEVRNKRVRPTERIKFTLALRDLIGLDIIGSGSLTSERIESNCLEIGISGSGNVQLDRLMAEVLEVRIAGSGEVKLVGEATEQDIVISGSGDYHAAGLRSESVEITINGSGDGTVWAIESLNVHINGSGSVNYYGRPRTSFSSSGSGKINSLGNP